MRWGELCGTGLLTREDEAENEDAAEVLTRGGDLPQMLPQLRSTAVDLGRVYLAAVVAVFK